MIFLSHTHKDKDIVDEIANKLKQVFGEEQIFYDSWSIQPGDHIIDKINNRLSSCKYFFFFVSKTSLQSEMVKLEWQNALYKSTKNKNELKIIPVRVDDCIMPAVLIQTLYIDIYRQGLEPAIRQMIDAASNKNNYVASNGFQNIRAYVNQDEQLTTVELRAEVYMEPHSKYLILVDEQQDELEFKAIGESQYENGFFKDLVLENGLKSNAISIGRPSATSPKFPFIVEIKTLKETLNLKGVMRAVSRDSFETIPMIPT